MREFAGTSTRSRKRVEGKKETQNETNARKKTGDGERQESEQENTKITGDTAVDTEGLSKEATELLADICNNPLSKVGERYKRLGIDEAKGNRARQLLEARGLIEPISLPSLEGRGYWGKALELTNNGRAALISMGFRLPDEISKRKGSLLHQHYLRLITESLVQAGHQVSLEHPLGYGEAADLLVDGQVAIELERSDRNTLQNVRKNLKRGFKVLLVAETSALERRIAGLLEKENLRGSVKVVQLKDFREGCGLDLIRSLLPSSPQALSQSVPAQLRFHEKVGE